MYRQIATIFHKRYYGDSLLCFSSRSTITRSQIKWACYLWQLHGPQKNRPTARLHMAYGVCPIIITKTYLYNFDPLKPHFYIVKLGFTGVYIISLISAQKHRLWVLVRIVEAVLTSTHNLCFEQKYEKYQKFLSEIFFFGGKIFSIFE